MIARMPIYIPECLSIYLEFMKIKMFTVKLGEQRSSLAKFGEALKV
jgi:hypothetical protein